MTSEKMNTKVRLVRCPKCRLVLPELPEISVYKCGGCNTVLQAKHRKPDMKEADQNHEADENGVKQSECVSNFTLLNGNSAISTLHESSSSSSTSGINDNISDENMNTKQPQEEVSSLSPAPQIEHDKDNTVDNISDENMNTKQPQDEESSLSPAPRIEHDKDNTVDNISDENMNTQQPQVEESSLSPAPRIEHDKDNTVSIPDSGQFENDFPTSTELTSNEMEDSSIELHHILGTENDTDQYTEADETKGEKTRRNYFGSMNFSDDVSSVMLDSSPESRTHENHSSKKVSNESPQDFKHLRAEDSPDHHLPVVESMSELHAKGPDFVKSPTRSYYACDQVPNRSSKPPRRKGKLSNGPLKRAESGFSSLLSSETEMRYHGYNRSGLDDDIMSTESEIQHLSSKAPFLEASNKDNITRVPSNRYERRDSGLFRPETALYNVPDKLELLKTINDLKDELNRTRISNPSFPARFSVEENHLTWPCHHQSADFTNCSQMKGLPPRPRISRMAYSGEATEYNHRGTCTCFSRARHYSGGIPLHGMCHCLAHNDHHQFLQEHETMSKNVRKIPTEKDRSSKRYVRPEVGGIPVLSCYHCSELLQFPAEFLLSSRKCHRLRCNVCREVMKFSLENGRHLIPYIPDDTVAPPPSMVDDYSQTSLPHPNIHTTVKPSSEIVAPPPSMVDDYSQTSSNHSNIRTTLKTSSFSDEYGTSIDRSCSIKSERVSRVPDEALKHGNMNKRNLTFGAFEPYNDHHHTRHKNSVETVGSSGNQKDLKEVPSTSGGAFRSLHRLMGYASPSQVFRR